MEAIAKACQEGNIPATIELVISNQTNVKGLERAKKFHLMSKVIEHQQFNSREEFDQALLEQILPIEPDLVVLAGFMRILSKPFITKYKNRIINIHPSLLPLFPGANAHRDVIKSGVKESGCTVHFVDEGVDTGPIIMQETVAVDKNDSEETLAAKILPLEHLIFPKALHLLTSKKLEIKEGKVIIRSD